MVVGATFAYFTASVKVSNPEQNTTTVKTKAFANATMTNGNQINSEEALPGFANAKSITITGQCGNSAETCESVETTLSVNATIDPTFESDVNWYLFKKGENEVTTISCTPTASGDVTNQVTGAYMTPSCTGVPADKDSAAIIHGNASGTKTTDITVTGQTNDTYYLYVEYANNSDQNTQQGKSFSVSLDFKPKSA